MKRTAIIIDGTNIVRRCIKATEAADLQAGGIATGGIYGTLSMLSSFLRSLDDDDRISAYGPILAFFDGGTPPTRLRDIPDYKANRKPMTDEERAALNTQLGHCRELLESLGVPTLEYFRREADDAVYAMAEYLHGQGTPSLVVSSDRDLLQVCRLGCSVWNVKTTVHPETFDAHVGVTIHRYLDYRTLCGDTSDGVKGAAGWGPKTSAAFLSALPPEQDGLAALFTYAETAKEKRCASLRSPDEQRRLLRARHGIDLRRHFATPSGASRLMHDAIHSVPRHMPDKSEFLRLCHKFRLARAMADLASFRDPFDWRRS